MQNKQINLLIKKINPLFKNGKMLISLNELENTWGVKEDLCFVALKELDEKGYMDVIHTDKRGKPYVYISINKKGKDVLLINHNAKVEIFKRVALALLSTIVTFFFGKIIYAIFS